MPDQFVPDELWAAEQRAASCNHCDRWAVPGTAYCPNHTTPNRVVLVDEYGRRYDRTGVTVEIDQQDNGLTLKVFVSPLPTDEHMKANADHLTALSQSLRLP